jgi:hypothetical protein
MCKLDEDIAQYLNVSVIVIFFTGLIEQMIIHNIVINDLTFDLVGYVLYIDTKLMFNVFSLDLIFSK